MRKPWFKIVEVTREVPRSIADIVAEVADERNVSLVEIRGSRQHKHLKATRAEAVRRVWLERPDLSSGQIAIFMHRDPSSIRHLVSRMEVTAA